jgi:hypothetical protein
MQHWTRAKRWRPGLWLFVVAAAGCTGEKFDRVTLTGSVTIDGQGVERGTIDFQPLEQGQGPSTTADIAAGKYTAEVPVGKLKVFFHATRETGKMIDVFGKQQPETENIIPAAYQSGIEITVSEGETTRDFALE